MAKLSLPLQRIGFTLPTSADSARISAAQNTFRKGRATQQPPLSTNQKD